MTLKVGDLVRAPYEIYIIKEHKKEDIRSLGDLEGWVVDKYLIESLRERYECWTYLSPRLKLTPEEEREAKAFYL
jgi:hypothetical protein